MVKTKRKRARVKKALQRRVSLRDLNLGGKHVRHFSASPKRAAPPKIKTVRMLKKERGALASKCVVNESTIQVKAIPVKSLVVPLPIKLSALTNVTNSIVVWKNGSAVVVDPGGEAEKIAIFLKRNKLKVGEYWLTHAHPDHVGGLSNLLDDFPAPVRYHRADSRWMRFSFPGSKIRTKWFRPFGAIRRIACGEIAAKVILTPGHTRGGVCYWFEELGILLSGDTLMRGYVGATCFPGGDSGELDASLRKIQRRVPECTKVFPGHGNTTTVGAELAAI